MPSKDSTPLPVGVRPYPDKPSYLISPDGRVFSTARRGRGTAPNPSSCPPGWGLEMRPRIQPSGHRLIMLGRGCYRYVHRLVLETFVGPCPPGMECRHLDGNPANNRLDNLRWGTPRENHEDSVAHGTAFLLAGEQHPGAKITATDAAAIGDALKRGTPREALAVSYGVSKANIDAIATGRSWSDVTGIEYRPQRRASPRRFTPEERVEMVRLRTAGVTSQAIADRLGLNIGSVRGTLYRLGFRRD